MAFKVITLLSTGVKSLVSAVTSSTGAASGNVVALNNSAKVDTTLLPTSGAPYVDLLVAQSIAGTKTFSAAPVLSLGYSETVSSATALASNGTIPLTNPVFLASLSASVTGVILTAGTVTGQTVTVMNGSTSFTITFAAAATSHVADGTSDVISANTARSFIWNGTNWLRKG